MHPPSPSAPNAAPFATPADSAACREMIRTGSRSFHTASLLLPDRIRNGAYALYAFCRLSDDAVDHVDAYVDGGRETTVAHLRRRLDRVFAGDPAPGVDCALADTVRDYAIPRAAFDALLEGLQWDMEGRACETADDLEAYAARVAGSVGVMMAALMGARSRDQVARACDLGLAMQLTNIARDVGEDARMGRLYLPKTWMREAGLDPESWLAAPVFTPALASVIARVLLRAADLYRRADAGIARLPDSFRPAIHAARLLYAEIGREVERRDLDSVSTRASVSAARKLWLVARALRSAHSRLTRDEAAQPAPATRFLVDAMEAQGAPAHAVATTGGVGRDVAWVLTLFASLDQRRAVGVRASGAQPAV